MSTFLDRLIGRARGADAVIEPVPVPVFAPEPALGDDSAEPVATADERVVSKEAEQPAQAAAALARASSGAPSLPPIERLMPPRSSAQDLRPASAIPSAAAHAPQLTNELRTLPSTRVTVTARTEAGQQDDDGDAAPLAAEPIAAPTTPAASATASPAAAPTRGAVRPSRVQRPSAPSTPAPTATTAAEPPVVHVTIGRIDVRAAAPAPPPPRRPQATRPTALSLEQYLAQRDRGER
ncbi:MAG TPA: hypothetical protein VN947_03345 [Polyangia bacterium]|nr:hypothetical protein [Polyangia bacterium]